MKKRNLWYVHPVEQNGKTAKYQFQMKASGNEKNNIIFFKIVHIVIKIATRSSVNESQL